MNDNDLNDNQVTVKCGLSVGLLGKARRGDSDLGKKSIDKILTFYPDINRTWFLTGEGEMLNAAKNPFSQMTEEEIKVTIAAELVKMYEQGVLYPAAVHDKIVEKLEKRNEDLVRENNDLRRKLDELTKG